MTPPQYLLLLTASDARHSADLAEIQRLDGLLAQARADAAGLEGELVGLRVSEAFFRQRCDVLEAVAVRKLAQHEADALKGCCPLCGMEKS